ncbi:MAG: 8-oxo-dGTP diphosphatase [Promethearchaeota archaeon]
MISIFVATLCQIIKDDKLLLQKKSQGLFGAEKWNGVGGKLKSNETPKDGIRREVYEETGLILLDVRYHGVLNFYFGSRDQLDWVVHVFSTRNFKGNIRSSKEGILKWFEIKDIPYDQMWLDDRYWLPLLLANRNFLL